MRSRLGVAAAIAALVFVSPPARAETVLLDAVVAVVGDTPILLSTAYGRAAARIGELAAHASPELVAAESAQVLKDAVNELVDAELVRREVVGHQISVSDKDVDSAIVQILLSNRITQKELQIQLDALGIGEAEYRAKVRDQIYDAQFFNIVLAPRIHISEEQIRERFSRDKPPLSLDAARPAITQTLLLEAKEPLKKAWLEAARRAIYVEVRL